MPATQVPGEMFNTPDLPSATHVPRNATTVGGGAEGCGTPDIDRRNP